MLCAERWMSAIWVLLVAVGSLGGLSWADEIPEWHPKPGDHFPYDFTTPVLGDVNFTLNNETVKAGPIIFYAYDPTDAYSRYMWSSDESVQGFLESTPPGTRYVFFSYGDKPLQDAQYFRMRIRDGLAALNVTDNDMGKRMQQFYFGTMNLASVSDVGANFLPYLLGQWPSPRRKLIANATDGWEVTTTRLSADFDWLPYSPPPTFTPLASLGNGCRDVEPFSLTGKVALIVQEDPTADKSCSYAMMIQKAQEANASAVVISAVPGRDVTKMQCSTVSDCNLPLNISAVQIPYTDAVDMRDALARGPVTVNYTVPDGGGYWAAVNEEGQLEQVGWEKWPTLMHLAWAAQWYDYMSELRANLTKPALVVPVFNNQPMAGENGLVGNVTMPSVEEVAQFDTVELDFALGCAGPMDRDCPYWDHTVQLYVCCLDPDGPQKPCEKCGPTVWGSIESNHKDRDPAEADWMEVRGPNFLQRSGHARPECGRELGRWITSFRRRVGRWLTDVTPLWPMLAGRHCTFRVQDPPWVEPWFPSLNLRFTKSNETTDGLKPFKLQYLPYNGGTFDKTYNTKEINPPFEFPTPEGTDKALLVATITGHGSDENNCAEFCPTSHHFIINGKEHLVNYTEAGTNWGCADKVREGSVPNESGTWHYGRNGWCDGQNIRPWLADITRDLKPPGQGNNTIEYKGLYRDVSPDPKTNPGSIIMQSNVAFYGKPGEGETAGPGAAGAGVGANAHGCRPGGPEICAAGSVQVGDVVDASLTGTIVKGLATVRLVLEQPH